MQYSEFTVDLALILWYNLQINMFRNVVEMLI